MVAKQDADADRVPTFPRGEDADLCLIDGVIAVPTRDAVRGLSTEFPELSETKLRSILVSEWEASTGGTPLLIPIEVIAAVREVIGERTR